MKDSLGSRRFSTKIRREPDGTCFIQEIDEEYEEEQLAIQQAIIVADAERQAELDFINEDTDEVLQVTTARQNPRHEKQPVKVDKNIPVSVKTAAETVCIV